MTCFRSWYHNHRNLFLLPVILPALRGSRERPPLTPHGKSKKIENPREVKGKDEKAGAAWGQRFFRPSQGFLPMDGPCDLALTATPFLMTGNHTEGVFGKPDKPDTSFPKRGNPDVGSLRRMAM